MSVENNNENSNPTDFEERELKKPMSLIVKELEDDLMFVINNCKVPAFIIKMVLEILLSKVEKISNSQLAKDKQQYEAYINE